MSYPVLKQAAEPVEPENDAWIERLAEQAALVVAVWGNHGAWQGRSQEVLHLLPEPRCLTVTKQGEPGHPLYLKKGLRPRQYTERQDLI